MRVTWLRGCRFLSRDRGGAPPIRLTQAARGSWEARCLGETSVAIGPEMVAGLPSKVLPPLLWLLPALLYSPLRTP